MIGFNLPLMFWAFAALLIPLLIHIFSRKPGPTLLVANIRDYTPSDSSRVRRILLEEPFLWLLRTVLLALLVLLLAQPWLSRPPAEEDLPGWVLLSPELPADPAFFQVQDEIQQLLDQGYELRMLGPDFPKTTLNSLQGQSVPSINGWSLLKEAETRVPPGKLHFYSTNRIVSFNGYRPGFDIQWRSVPSQAVNRWIESIWRDLDDQVRVTIGVSNAESCDFQTYTLNENDDAFTIKQTEEGQTVCLSQTDAFPLDDQVPIPTNQPILVTVVTHPERAQDQAYLKAAIQTAAPLNLVQTRFQTLPDMDLTNADIIFYLAPGPLPEPLQNHLRDGALVIRDAPSERYDITTATINAPGYTHSPALHRRTPAGEGQTLWTDDQQIPLLQYTRQGKGRLIQFHSRFHPAWNNLVLNPLFPEWIFATLIEESPAIQSAAQPLSDFRCWSQALAQPPVKEAKAPSIPVRKSDLSSWLWLLTALAFLGERFLSERTRP